MNGAQVASAVEIVTKVSTGELPKESAIEMLSAFFKLPIETAKKMIEPASKIKLAQVPHPLAIRRIFQKIFLASLRVFFPF